MIHGQSSQRGILFADGAATGDNAVYCCYEGGEIVCLTGPLEDLRPLFKSERDADKVPGAGKRGEALMLASCALMAVVVVLAGVFGSTMQVTAGALVFALVGAFPLMSLLTAGTHEFGDPALFEQLKRNHGAEHAALAYHRKTRRQGNWSWSLEELRECSHLDPECGTVYLGALLVWAAVAGVAIGCSGSLGALKVVGILVGAAVLLVLNTWFNPHNPLKLLQLCIVARPGDRELQLAAAGMQRLLEVTGKR